MPISEPQAEKPSTSKKTAAKANDKKEKAVEIVKEEPLDPLAEKLRQQRLLLHIFVFHISSCYKLINTVLINNPYM